MKIVDKRTSHFTKLHKRVCQKCGKEFACYRNQRKHCGCEPNATTHGMKNTRQYRIWNSMRQRCKDKSQDSYKYYGAKGTAVCKRWRKFVNFWEDMKEGYNDRLSIDRIDNNKGYSKENCRWATMKEQQNNRTNNRYVTIKGERKTVSEWLDHYGIQNKRKTIESRVYNGMEYKKSILLAIK